ncbi:MAG TPA: hypothetical protein VFY38_05690 [Pseudonocardia sp.]|nr:hypothetical protein [Pseudonocardia sp.]
MYRPVDAPPLRDEPPRPIDGVFDEEGWLAYGSPLPDVRPA